MRVRRLHLGENGGQHVRLHLGGDGDEDVFVQAVEDARGIGGLHRGIGFDERCDLFFLFGVALGDQFLDLVLQPFSVAILSSTRFSAAEIRFSRMVSSACARIEFVAALGKAGQHIDFGGAGGFGIVGDVVFGFGERGEFGLRGAVACA